MNNVEIQEPDKKKYKASDIYEEIEAYEDLSCSEDESDNLEEEEAEEDFDDEQEDSVDEELRKAYIPCAAHNLQLVIKDGLKLSPEYISLTNNVSKNIVSKSKYSSIIAEQMSEFGKKFAKKM